MIYSIVKAVSSYWDKYACANCVDPDQTAPRGAVWSGSALCAIQLTYKFSSSDEIQYWTKLVRYAANRISALDSP